MPNVRWCLRNGVHAVVGTTGLTPADLEELRAAAEAGTANCVVAPNFALGAVLLLRFAAEAARYFDAAEVIELHHDGKADAPSGTAIATARAIAAAREGGWSAPEAVGQYAGAPLVYWGLWALLRTAITELPPSTRAVFLRARVQNQGYAEIGRELGMSVRTVERRMAEAMTILCGRLRDAP